MKVTLIVDEVTELFQDYLKLCGIFKSFLTAADIDTEEGLFHYVKGFYTSSISYDLLIDYAFSWDRTDEGVTFWSNRDQEWRSFLLEQTNTSFKNLKSIW